MIYLVDFSKFGKDDKESKNKIKIKEEIKDNSESKNEEKKVFHKFKNFNEYKTEEKAGEKINPVTGNKPKIIRRFISPKKPTIPEIDKPKEVINQKTTNKDKKKNSQEKPKDIKRKVLVKCPICKTQKEIEIPENIINRSKQLTAISINHNSVCEHSFQVFVDKNFKVRGTQKLAYEINGENEDEKEKKKFDRMMDLAKGMDNLREYDKAKETTLEERIKNNEMTLKDIYETFWDFIDDNNHEFREFIIKDPRRSINT